MGRKQRMKMMTMIWTSLMKKIKKKTKADRPSKKERKEMME